MNSPKVSILIPVYNTAQYLGRCLDSVLNQSLKEIEVIAVNDASPDRSADILAEYAAKDPRVRIVTHEKNGGILAARVSGIRAAKSPYVTFLDADDLLAERAMELAYRKAVDTGADIVHFAAKVFDESEFAETEHLRRAEKKLLPFNGALLEHDIFDQAFQKQAYRWTVWGKLYHIDLCRNAADILPDGYYLMAEDLCFYTLISFYAHHYEGMDYQGYLYFLNAGVSAYQPIDLAGFRRRCSIFTVCRAVRWFLESRGVFEKYQDAFRKQENLMLGDLVHRWRRNLLPQDRHAAFDLLFQSYDPIPLFRAFTDFFVHSDTELPEFLTGPRAVPSPAKIVSRIGLFSPAVPTTGTASFRTMFSSPKQTCPARKFCPDSTEIPRNAGTHGGNSLKKNISTPSFSAEKRIRIFSGTPLRSSMPEPRLSSVKKMGSNPESAPVSGTG